GSLFGFGATQVTCSATDGAGNTGSASFVVTVADTTAPAIDAVDDLVVEAEGADGAIVEYEAPAARDAVDGTSAATCAPASGGLFALGSTLVACSATDAAGNAAVEATFTVRVVDTTAPVIAAADDVAAEATSAAGALVSYAAPATSDLVDGDGVADCSPASGSLFGFGATTVTCSATDAAGNAAADVTFTVVVADTTAPAIAPMADIVAQASGLQGAVVAYDAPATSDLVDGAGVASCAPASGALFAVGNTTVTCVATDAAGNVATSTFDVRVVLTVVRSLATEKQTYTAREATLDGVRGVFHLETGDGTPLANASVKVRVLRQVAFAGYTNSEEMNGTTDENGDFRFDVPSTFAQPGARYVLIGTVHTPGLTGGVSNAAYNVTLAEQTPLAR
ncbi:MAG TPA: HYR domain-containing protein, partial [Candidatus Thermoplasmatota archaeon]|nr:HYR domain-containing protein [Candidatus Thermoplasmatota archaeon]